MRYSFDAKVTGHKDRLTGFMRSECCALMTCAATDPAMRPAWLQGAALSCGGTRKLEPSPVD